MFRIESEGKAFRVKEDVCGLVLTPVLKNEEHCRKLIDHLYDEYEEPFLTKRKSGGDLHDLADTLVNVGVLVSAKDVMRFFKAPQRYSTCYAAYEFNETSDDDKEIVLAKIEGRKAKTPAVAVQPPAQSA